MNIDGTLTLIRPQFDALLLALPWQDVGEAGVITTVARPLRYLRMVRGQCCRHDHCP